MLFLCYTSQTFPYFRAYLGACVERSLYKVPTRARIKHL